MPLRACLILLFATLIPSNTLRAELPAKARQLVDACEKDISKITLETEAGLRDAVEAVVTKLKREQDSSTRNGQLDEALLIRDHLRRVDSATTLALQQQALLMNDQKLPTDAFLVTTELRATIEQQQEKASRRRDDRRKECHRELRRLQDEFTRVADLEAAVAIRDFLGNSPDESAVPAANTDYDAAKRLFAETVRRLNEESNSACVTAQRQLLPKLRAAQAEHTKKGNLDQAVAIRDLLKDLTSARGVYRQQQVVQKSQQKVPTDVAILLDGFLRDVSVITTRTNKEIAKEKAKMLKATEPELRKQLQTDDGEKCYALVSEFQSLSGEHMRWSPSRPDANVPPVSAVAMKSVNAFQTAATTRREDGDQHQRILRSRLLEKLADDLNSENLADAEQTALRSAIEYLSADYSLGLRGLLLFEIDAKLPERSRRRVEEFVATTSGMIQEIKVQHRTAIMALKEALRPIRQQHAAKGEYLDAFATFTAIHPLDHVFDPITVKARPAQTASFYWDAQVLDAKGDDVLVRFRTGRPAEWMPRERIHYGAGDPPDATPTPSRTASRMRASDNPPGREIARDTRLVKGQKLVCLWGSRWYPVTVLEVTPAGIRIHWEGYSDGFDRIVGRNELRSIEDDADR